MSRVLLFWMVSAVSSVSLADTNENIAKCAAVDDKRERLSCFDDLSKKLGLEKSMATVGKGKWQVTESISRIDDSPTVYVMLKSNEAVRGKTGMEHPALWLRCDENKTEVIIDVGLYLGVDKTSVLTRLDKEKAITNTWTISTNTKAIFVQNNPIGFAKNLMKHERLLVKLTPINDNPVTFEFDIEGLSEAIKPLRKACHW